MKSTARKFTIEEYCEAARILQKDLAERFGVNKDAITRGKAVGWYIVVDGRSVELVSPKGKFINHA